MIRINDLARDLGVRSRSILDVLPLVGVKKKKTHSSSIEDDEADKVRAYHVAHPEKCSVPSWVYRQSDAILSSIDHSHIPKAGDTLKVTQSEATLAETAGERSQHAPVTPLSPTVDAPLRRAAPAVVIPRSTLTLPEGFSFYTPGFVNFDHVMQYFNWDIRGSLTIDLSTCLRSNFQVLALLVQYAWYLTLHDCTVTFKYGTASSGPTKMLTAMGALDWREVLINDGRDFGNNPGRKTYALRRRSDVQSTINNARGAIKNYSIGFPAYLSYLISELLYNATEHGRRTTVAYNCQVVVPAIFQFGLYSTLNRLSFLFSDLGIGIKAHLEQ